MIAKGADNWDRALFGAGQSGNIEIARMVIAKGATDWNQALFAACKFGHRELANFMVASGATECASCGTLEH